MSQPRAGHENVESKTLSTRRRQETRRDRAAIRRERGDRVGKSNSFVRVSTVPNRERPPHRRRDKQRAGRDGWRHRHVYPGEIARTEIWQRRGDRRTLAAVQTGQTLRVAQFPAARAEWKTGEHAAH